LSTEIAKTIIGSVKGLIIKKIVEQAMKALLAKLPFLAWGPLGWIASHFLTKLLEFLIDKTILGATILYIDISNAGKVSDVETVIEKIAEAKVKGATNEELDELDKELAKKGRDLIKFGHLT